MTKETLHGAMALAFAEIEAATKSANNPHFKSKYADITAVIEAVKPALAKHGLFFTQHPQPSEGGVTVETLLHHASGESMSMGSLFVPANRNDAQGFGSALTYCRRYALVTAFGVPTEDDDGNAASKAPPPAKPAKAPAWREVDSIYSTPSALHKALTQLERELAGCGDSEMVYGLTATDEWKEFVRVSEKHSPHYLRGGDPAPPEFRGLLNIAADMVAKFDGEVADNMAALART
jgi:hypothetical protein